MNELTKEQKALGAFLAAMQECGHDGTKMREAMLGVLGIKQPVASEPSSGERAELNPLRCVSGAGGSSDYCGFCRVDMCFSPPICPSRVQRALKEIPMEDVQAYGCSWEAQYPQYPDSRCEKWCGRPECPVTLTPESKHHILGVTITEKAAALLSSDAKPASIRSEIFSPLFNEWYATTDGNPTFQECFAAGLSAQREHPAIEDGFVRVPLRMTRAMQRVVEEDEWEWADVLVAANAVTEEEYEIALQGEASEPVAVPQGWKLIQNPITEDMHIAAVKVLQRANGIDGLPQRMLDAMLSAAPSPAPVGINGLAEAGTDASASVAGLINVSGDIGHE